MDGLIGVVRGQPGPMAYGWGVDDKRPPGLIVAAACSALLGATFLVFALISAAAGHGMFSIQIGILLSLYAVALIGSAGALWRRRLWARGPIVAIPLMAGFGFGEYLLDQPWMVLLVVLCLGAVVGVALPSTSAALRERVSSSDRPRQRGLRQRLRARFGRTGQTPR